MLNLDALLWRLSSLRVPKEPVWECFLLVIFKQWTRKICTPGLRNSEVGSFHKTLLENNLGTNLFSRYKLRVACQTQSPQEYVMIILLLCWTFTIEQACKFAEFLCFVALMEKPFKINLKGRKLDSATFLLDCLFNLCNLWVLPTLHQPLSGRRVARVLCRHRKPDPGHDSSPVQGVSIRHFGQQTSWQSAI